VDVDVDGAGKQESLSVVQRARPGVPRRADVLDPAVAEREAGADGGSVWSQDLPGNLLSD
jgi:hypothetical protein